MMANTDGCMYMLEKGLCSVTSLEEIMHTMASNNVLSEGNHDEESSFDTTFDNTNSNHSITIHHQPPTC
jgi:hypothetical protein